MRRALPLLVLIACSSPRSSVETRTPGTGAAPPPNVVAADASAPDAQSLDTADAHAPDAGAPDASDTDPLRAEAKRRLDALLAEHFNLTHGFLFDPANAKPLRVDLLLPPDDGEHRFSFWADVGTGTLSMRIVGPTGSVVAAWSGHHGELSFALDAPPGKYALEIDRSPQMRGRALFGVRGAVLARCEAPKGGAVREIAKADAKGFHWPYLLYVPQDIHDKRLLVLPNNTGFATEDLEALRLSGSCDVARSAPMANRLGVPVLVPLFPRPRKDGPEGNVYLHALSRAALEVKTEKLTRVDKQLVAMIANARGLLHADHIDVDPKVLMAGFSASGSFVNRFALLHSEVVAAVACGSPGGWPLAPAAGLEKEPLNYPVGVDDVAALTGKAVDVAAARKVAFFFFMGDKDDNDAVPYLDSFSAADKELVFRKFGQTPVARWPAAERMYRAAGMNARFVLYPGEGHNVSAEMARDIEQFLGQRR